MVMPLIVVLGAVNQVGFSPTGFIRHGAFGAAAWVAALLAGSAIASVIRGKFGFIVGVIVGLVLGLAAALVRGGDFGIFWEFFEAAAWIFIMPGATAFFARPRPDSIRDEDVFALHWDRPAGVCALVVVIGLGVWIAGHFVAGKWG